MATPNIDYTSRDYEGLRASLLAYAKTAFPEWQPASEGDFGVLLVEMLAYMGDVLSYYTDRAQNEAYLPTATQRSSILNIAQLLGYKVDTGTPATGKIVLKSAAGSPEIFVPKGTRFATKYIDVVDGPIIFETTDDVVVPMNGGSTPAINSTNPDEPPVVVVEGETKQDETTGGPLHLADSSGNPDQTFRLPHPRVYQETVEVFVDGEPWAVVDHLLDGEAGDKIFSVSLDASGYTWVTFGDGINGAIPPLGIDIAARYRTGFGFAGNLPAGSIISVYKPIAGLSIDMINSTTSTCSATEGGADPEGNEQIRVNAPRAFKSHERAVTLEDYANFALSVPGVAKASATAEFFSSVVVYILGPDGNDPSTTLIERTQRDLVNRSLAGVSVTVESPNRVKINVGAPTDPVVVRVWPTHTASAVQFNVEQAIKSYLAFANCDLGARLTVSELYSAIMDVEGVRYASIPLLARDDAPQVGTSDIQLKPMEFPVANSINVTTEGGIG